MHSRIVGTGSYLPAQVLTNHELARRVDTSDAWIRARTGIRERRIAAPAEMTSDLAEHAARAALAAAGIAPAGVDLIVVGFELRRKTVVGLERDRERRFPVAVDGECRRRLQPRGKKDEQQRSRSASHRVRDYPAA